jgi:uncharacterized protein YPO0396
VVAESALATEDFSDFSRDVTQLRKRLNTTAGVTLHDSFPAYGADFQRRFGIGSEQAMDLFYETVSMKSMGNLTEFVRQHMLEPFPVQPRIDALVTHFGDLNCAHEAALKARAQIERPQPLTADCNQHAALVQQVDALRRCRDALRPWFAHLKGELLDKRIANWALDEERAGATLTQFAHEWRTQARTRDELTAAISANGGNRIEQIRAEIARIEESKKERSERAQKYDLIAGALGLPAAVDADTFDANDRAIAAGQSECFRQRDERSNRLTETGVTVRDLRLLHAFGLLLLVPEAYYDPAYR